MPPVAVCVFVACIAMSCASNTEASLLDMLDVSGSTAASDGDVERFGSDARQNAEDNYQLSDISNSQDATVADPVVPDDIGGNSTFDDEVDGEGSSTDSVDGESTTADTTTEALDGTDDGAATASDGDDSPTEYTLFIGDWTLEPGQESTRCVEKRLSNDAAILVTSITTTLSQGSHHLIVYRMEDGPENLDPYPCAPFAGGVSGTEYPLMISEIPSETLQFPQGVGLELQPKQRIRIEAHYLNYYPEEITAHADVTFNVATNDEITEKANLIFYGNSDIALPPGSEVTGDWSFIDLPDDTFIFAITGHTHQWGTNVEVSLSDSWSNPGLSLYPGEAPFVWDEAPIETFSPPVAVDSSHGLRFRCSWKNDSDAFVSFGQSANDEMCFLWAYYYPDKGFQVSF